MFIPITISMNYYNTAEQHGLQACTKLIYCHARHVT